jgi:hypothetical protein
MKLTSLPILLSLLTALSVSVAAAAAEAQTFAFELTPADGAGADAYTDSNNTTTAFGANDPTRLLIRRNNTKAYIRFDLEAYPGYAEMGRIQSAELRIEQIGNPLRIGEVLQVFAVNLNYDFSTDNRIGIDWSATELTHANAPASGAGGGASVANSRSLLLGAMEQSPDGTVYRYHENAQMAATPLLDYLNGFSGFSRTDTPLRLFIITEAPDQARNTKVFASSENSVGASPPTLNITYVEKPPFIWSEYPLVGDYRYTPHGWIYERRYPSVWLANHDLWIEVVADYSSADGWYAWDYHAGSWIFGRASGGHMFRYSTSEQQWQTIP